MKKLVFEIEGFKKEKRKVKPPKCWICMDQGLVIYDKKVNGMIYEMAARCRCVKGQEVGDKVGYIHSVLVEDIASINFENFKKAYPEVAVKIANAI